MKVEVDLTEYGFKAPKWYDPISPHVINASGGGGGDVELTLEEYEALSEEEKMNGSNYFITDIGNPKSLTKKVLAYKSGPFTLNTEVPFTLSESFLNYDYISIIYNYGNTQDAIRNIKTVDTSNYTSGNIELYIMAGVNTTSWFGASQFAISNGTECKINVMQDIGGLLTNYTNITVIGYRYERVVVPNQMVNYSTVEQRIGTWIDGKPLYQKTWDFTEGQVFPVRDTWFDTNIEAEYIDKIIFASGYRSDSNYVGIIGAGLNQSNHIVLMQGRDNNFGNFKGFTLQYTKTTD